MNAPTFEEFAKGTARTSWIKEGTLEIYMRRNYFEGEGWAHIDFDLASVSNSKPGNGDFKRFLDRWEPIYTFFIENVSNPRLAAFLLKRGYVIMQRRFEGNLVSSYHMLTRKNVSETQVALEDAGFAVVPGLPRSEHIVAIAGEELGPGDLVSIGIGVATKPTVFGVGVWRMRDGGKAVITSNHGVDECYPLVGYIEGFTSLDYVWRRNGFYTVVPCAYDLVGPWVEEGKP